MQGDGVGEVNDTYNLANAIAEWTRIVQELRKAIGPVPHVKPLRPEYGCTVQINTKGHQRKPCRVARSMRRVGRK